MSDQVGEGASMTASFEYVRQAYRTAARMLLSADALLVDRKLAVYSWHAIWPSRSTSLSRVDWLPGSVFRHYHSPELQNREVLTLAAVFFATDEHTLTEPLCIGSRMWVHHVATNDVYWWALVQRWALDAAPSDGLVRRLDSKSVSFTQKDQRQNFDGGVVGGALATVAVPLLNIRGTSDLEEQVISPLLAFPFETLPGGASGAP